MKLFFATVFVIACMVSFSSPEETSQTKIEISETDSIEAVDTFFIQNPAPPYNLEETIVKRKVPLLKNYTEKTETLQLQRPYPPYDFHDTIIKTKTPKY